MSRSNFQRSASGFFSQIGEAVVRVGLLGADAVLPAMCAGVNGALAIAMNAVGAIGEETAAAEILFQFVLVAQVYVISRAWKKKERSDNV